MRCRWMDLLKKGDPYYNRNLTLSKWNYSLLGMNQGSISMQEISVVIPNYNGLKYVKGCLDSLRAQTFPDLP